ncbi:MAG: hypothetical protein M3238_07975, partial [Actinomycetota bacterium]|nr:hypothetical protein [Actinomycetota bacterium]
MAICATAAVAAWLIPGVDVGVAIPIVAVAIACAIVAAASGRVTKLEVTYGGLALFLTLLCVWRSAEWVLAVDVLAAGGLATVAVTEARSWTAMFAAPVTVLRRLGGVPRLVLGPVTELLGRRSW